MQRFYTIIIYEGITYIFCNDDKTSAAFLPNQNNQIQDYFQTNHIHLILYLKTYVFTYHSKICNFEVNQED